MKLLLLLGALLTAQLIAAQTDTLADSNPSQQITKPNAVLAKNSSTEKYKIEPEKNAETVEEIKARTAKREQKAVRKYKGKKADTTANSKKR